MTRRRLVAVGVAALVLAGTGLWAATRSVSWPDRLWTPVGAARLDGTMPGHVTPEDPPAFRVSTYAPRGLTDPLVSVSRDSDSALLRRLRRMAGFEAEPRRRYRVVAGPQVRAAGRDWLQMVRDGAPPVSPPTDAAALAGEWEHTTATGRKLRLRLAADGTIGDWGDGAHWIEWDGHLGASPGPRPGSELSIANVFGTYGDAFHADLSDDGRSYVGLDTRGRPVSGRRADAAR